MKANTFSKSVLLYLVLLVSFFGINPLDAAQSEPQLQPYPIGNNEAATIAIDPTDPQIAYATIPRPHSEVFKTTDGGQSWQSKGNIEGVYVNVLRIAPNNHNIIYAGGAGIAKSTDGGDSWIFLTNNIPANGGLISDIAIDPQNPNIVYASVENGWGSNATGNIYKSGDGGTTWQIKDKGIFRNNPDDSQTGTAIYSLEIDPTNSQVVYATTRLDTVNHIGVYKSADGGENWTVMSNCLPLADPNYQQFVSDLVIDPHHSRPAAIVNNRYYIYSNNCWQAVEANNNPVPGNHIKLVFHPTNPNVIYRTNFLFMKSVDGGVNWVTSGNVGNINDMAVSPLSPNTVFVASKVLNIPWWSGADSQVGGLYKSTDQGTNWSEVSTGINATSIRDVAVDPQNPSYIYYSGTETGITFRSQDGGLNWSPVSLPGPSGQMIFTDNVSDIAIDHFNPANVYIASAGQYRWLYKSTTHGQSFVGLQTPAPSRCITVDPQNSNTIYIGSFGKGIYKSIDGGSTWVQKNTGLPAFDDGSLNVFDLAVDPNNSLTVWAIMVKSNNAGEPLQSGVFKTNNRGENWELVKSFDKNW